METGASSARRRLAAYEARLDAILAQRDGPGMALPASDPAHMATCLRDSDGGPLWLVCAGCPWGPGGEAFARRNSVCLGVEAVSRQRAVLARLEGRREDAEAYEAVFGAPAAGGAP